MLQGSQEHKLRASANTVSISVVGDFQVYTRKGKGFLGRGGVVEGKQNKATFDVWAADLAQLVEQLLSIGGTKLEVPLFTVAHMENPKDVEVEAEGSDVQDCP